EKAIGKDGKVLLLVRRVQVCTEPGGVSSNQSSGWEDHTVQAMKTTSFASALHAKNKTPKVNFRILNEENMEDADFVIPKENVEMAHARFANSLSKFGFQSMIKDDDDVYYFKFTSLTGRIGYARALIEVSADIDLKKEVTMAVPLLIGEGHIKEKMVVEYDWTPPRYDDCKVFGHLTHDCPKRVVEPVKEVLDSVINDGFTEVKKKKHKSKQVKQVDGVRLSKPKPSFYYRKVEKGETSSSAGNIQAKVAKSNANTSDGAPKTSSTKEPSGVLNESNSDDLEELIIEGPDRRRTDETELAGVSTPIDEVIMENKLSVCAILESHVAVSNLDKLCPKVFRNWDWTTNGNLCSKGTRIMLGWNKYEVDVTNQKQKGGEGILKKIDRVFGNLEFNESFVGAHAIFHPYRVSDHSPTVLILPSKTKFLPKPFKFINILAHHVKFKDVVSEGWASSVSGFCMFKVVKKLKILKKPLRKLLYAHGNIHENVTRLRTEVDNAQKALDTDPFNLSLREQEATYVNAYNEALILQERFLKQRAKIQWLKEGIQILLISTRPLKAGLVGAVSMLLLTLVAGST
nr:hypothetical protein [Tanacetum cinerariifolium]